MAEIDAGGWRLAYTDEGSGRPVVLLHGLLMDSTMWDAQTAALRDAYRVLRFDAPGHGASEPRPGPFSLAHHAAAIIDAARTLELGPAVWGGHSMGAYTVLHVALDAPDLVAGLVLIDGNPGVENPDMVPQYDALLAVAKDVGISEDLAVVVAGILFADHALTTEDGARWVKRFAALDGHAIEGACRAVFDRPGITARLGEIGQSALVIHGADDFPNPIQIARDLAESLAGSELIEIEGSGHTPPVERPEVVARALRDFADRVLA